MDAISPEYRLDPTTIANSTFIYGEWAIDDDHALMMHQPTRLIFSIYLADDADSAAASIYQLRSRLTHACDGQPIAANIAALGACAINAFACLTERVEITDPTPHRPIPKPLLADDDIPF